MSAVIASVGFKRCCGESVIGEALVSEEGFSPRYDLDRWTGEITKFGHNLQGRNIKDKVCFFPTAKGGIAAGWAFADIKGKGIAPKAFVFGVTNPVMVQGAVHADITLVDGIDLNAWQIVRSGDIVRVDTLRKLIEVIHRA